MSYHIITSKEDIECGVQALTRQCTFMLQAHQIAGLPPLRRPQNNYQSLARTITGQLLSVASASAIWSRVEQLARPFEPARLLAVDESALRAAGLSNAKIKTLRALAMAVETGEVDFARFTTQPESVVRQQLMRVHGIGPWTADIYVMFCLGRADGFAPGDVALANAVAMLQRLSIRPNPAELAKIAQKWSPWRGVAARLLWHYYGVRKNIKTEND